MFDTLLLFACSVKLTPILVFLLLTVSHWANHNKGNTADDVIISVHLV